VDARKKRPILQHASADNELSRAARIHCAQLGSHFQDCFGFGREIKRVFCFVIIEALQSKPIIEEHRRTARAIGEKTVKSAVQALREIRLLFRPMDQV